ncbi:ABC transporter ATP-binding protein [Foetidibacter luteolus]|uniref:ABC transporter ATP-binding protein n=1 Tax=Foetidibacter luteolus TaxID=2608880 RepID=UPI00129BC71E|nr:ABC transporter ATP-binding protein [Foetidibacter luteolus]
MQVILNNTGKRFNRDWIFRNLSYSFKAGKAYAITGPNGSGKSTLLQVLAGSMGASEGAIEWQAANGEWAMGNEQGKTPAIAHEEVHKHISIVAPYLELIEEMTVTEFLQFHQTFKPFISGVGIKHIIEIIGLEKAADKQIRYYSSGMKQRVKLAQAIFAEAPILLLDEPCTNLDATGYELYHNLVKNYAPDKLVIVSSNDINEYNFCEERISIMDYKAF